MGRWATVGAQTRPARPRWTPWSWTGKECADVPQQQRRYVSVMRETQNKVKSLWMNMSASSLKVRLGHVSRVYDLFRPLTAWKGCSLSPRQWQTSTTWLNMCWLHDSYKSLQWSYDKPGRKTELGGWGGQFFCKKLKKLPSRTQLCNADLFYLFIERTYF